MEKETISVGSVRRPWAEPRWLEVAGGVENGEQVDGMDPTPSDGCLLCLDLRILVGTAER